MMLTDYGVRDLGRYSLAPAEARKAREIYFRHWPRLRESVDDKVFEAVRVTIVLLKQRFGNLTAEEAYSLAATIVKAVKAELT